MIHTVRLISYNKIWIRFEANQSYLKDLNEYFRYTIDGYWFSPKWKSGEWDGKIGVFVPSERKLPYGLLFEWLSWHKKNYPNYKTIIDEEIKDLFKGYDVKLQDLKLPPRPYQKETLEKCIKNKRGLFILPTASGKTLAISYILSHLHRDKKVNQSLVVVPTQNLVIQFYNDMIDYGIPEKLLGKFFADEKNWESPIIISTWQSLSYDPEKLRKNEMQANRKKINDLEKKLKNLKKEETIKKTEKEIQELKERYAFLRSKEHREKIKEAALKKTDLLENVDCVIVDECQFVSSNELFELMKKVKNADYRFGCTGTLPDEKIDLARIKSFIGPILKRHTVKELTDMGYLNKCTIHKYRLYYEDRIKGNYEEVKEGIFKKKFRLKFIKSKIKEINDDNVLILVGRIEKEGKILEKELIEEFPDHQIKFLHGKISAKVREEWRQKCINEKKVILIAVFKIFQQGVNIPRLSNIILASSYKAKLQTLQSIGRSLRKGDKESIVIDIIDMNNNFLPNQAKTRQKFYDKEEFDTKEFVLKEREFTF